MADIFNGGTVKLFYNLDTANQNVISSGNIEIENVATFPTFSISDSANKIETYDSEYTRTVVGDKAIGDLEIVVNYRPDSETHQFLDSAYDNKTEFQLIVNYIEDQDAGKVEAVIVSGNINSRMISGDKDDVVRMTYTYSPRTIISMGTRVIPPVLRRGDYGVGSDGTPDYPQYSPQEAEGNAFVMIPAADTDNPAGVDLYGIELVSQPTGQTNSNLMMTNSGDLRIYARNNTTPWSRIYTSGESDTLYLSKVNNLSDVDSVIDARTNLDVYSKLEGDARFMIGSRNLSELTDKDAALANLGIISLSAMDTRYLKVASNLSDLSDVGAARTNLLVQGLQCNSDMASGAFNALYSPNGANSFRLANDGSWRIADGNGNSIPLVVSAGGTGANTPEGARTNLELDRFNQAPSETYIQSPDKKKYFTISNDYFGFWDASASTFIPLGISQGGTGSTTSAVARLNLGVDRLNQFGSVTSITSGNKTKSIIVNDDGVWGGYNETTQSYIPLSLSSGGTGGWDVASSKANLQIDRLQQQDNGTFVRGNTPDTGLFMMGNDWGAMRLSSGTPIALGITHGGTGATTLSGARTNLQVDRIVQGSGYSSLFSSDNKSQLTVRDDGGWGVFVAGTGAGTGWKPLLIGQGGTGGRTVDEAKNNLGLGWGQQALFDSVLSTGFKSADYTFAYGAKINGAAFSAWPNKPTALAIDGNSTDVAVGVWRVTIPGKGYAGAMDAVLWANGASQLRLTTSTGVAYDFNSSGTASGGNWQSTSDIRLKRNIVPIENALDKVLQLTGYTYDKYYSIADAVEGNKNYSSDAGFIAQDVQKVLPEAVSAIGEDDILGIKNGNIDGLVVNALKELNTKLEDQQDQINQLMAMVHAQSITINELRNK